MKQICTYALGSFLLLFFFPSLGWGSVVCESYIFVFMVQIYGLGAFFFFFYLCPLSRSVPLRFYVNFSYQLFSLWGLAVLCEWSDGHSSLCLSLAHTLTRARTHSERWLMCGWSVRGARAAEVGWCRLGVKWGGCADQPRTSCSGLFLLV